MSLRIISTLFNNIIDTSNHFNHYVNIICLISGIILTAKHAVGQNQLHYFLVLPDNKSLNMHLYTSDDVNVTGCDQFKVPEIKFICDGAAHTLDIKMAVEAGVVEKRVDSCLQARENLYYAGILIVEGLLGEKEANKLGVVNMKYWKRAFKALNTKFVTNKVVTFDHQDIYEWAKINYLKKAISTANDFGFIKWMKDAIRIVYGVKKNTGSNSIGCKGYDVVKLNIKDAGLDYLDDNIMEHIIKLGKEKGNVIKNPCGRIGEMSSKNSQSFNGTGDYSACIVLIQGLFNSLKVWKIQDTKYEGPPLLGLEAINSLFRSLSYGIVTSKENLTREGTRACTATRTELLFDWISCSRLAFIDYIIYTKYAKGADTHVIATASMEETHLIKRTKWLLGYVLMDYSAKHEMECCKHRQETGGHAIIPSFTFTFLFAVASNLLLSVYIFY